MYVQTCGGSVESGMVYGGTVGRTDIEVLSLGTAYIWIWVIPLLFTHPSYKLPLNNLNRTAVQYDNCLYGHNVLPACLGCRRMQGETSFHTFDLKSFSFLFTVQNAANKNSKCIWNCLLLPINYVNLGKYFFSSEKLNFL